jgi:hypothetical protein
VLLVPDHPGAEALLVQVALAAVSAVEALRVDAEQPVHRGRDLRARRFEDQVEVAAEQTPGVDAQAKALLGDAEQAGEARAIAVVAEDENPARSSARDMPDPVGKLPAAESRHRLRR